MADLVSFHKALASSSRLRILSLLGQRSLCVNALARLLGISQPAVSQHLEVLKRARLVVGERTGTMIHYRLDRNQAKFVEASTALLLGQSSQTGHTCGKATGVAARGRKGQSK